jgi:hypothetical protein
MICGKDTTQIINELMYKGYEFTCSYNRKSRTNPITNPVSFDPFRVKTQLKKGSMYVVSMAY